MVTMGPQHPRRNSVARKAKELMKLGVQVEIETPTRVKTYSGAKYFQDIHPV
ncbi:hypothetical protein JCM19233_6009 [Vibrio astriarenae]|nr:hypothetical protein JCM19233_6009 [Vibrio sp. C7]